MVVVVVYSEHTERRDKGPPDRGSVRGRLAGCVPRIRQRGRDGASPARQAREQMERDVPVQRFSRIAYAAASNPVVFHARLHAGGSSGRHVDVCLPASAVVLTLQFFGSWRAHKTVRDRLDAGVCRERTSAGRERQGEERAGNVWGHERAAAALSGDPSHRNARCPIPLPSQALSIRSVLPSSCVAAELDKRAERYRTTLRISRGGPVLTSEQLVEPDVNDVLAAQKNEGLSRLPWGGATPRALRQDHIEGAVQSLKLSSVLLTVGQVAAHGLVQKRLQTDGHAYPRRERGRRGACRADS